MTLETSRSDLIRNMVHILVPGAIVLGFLVSAPMFSEDFYQYLLLNIVCLVALTLLMNVIIRQPLYYLPLIIVLIVIFFGHFVKFYSLCFMYNNIDIFEVYLLGRFPLEYEILSSSDVTIKYFQHLTVYMVVMALFSVVCSKFVHEERSPASRGADISAGSLIVAWVIAGVAAISVLIAMWYFQIGVAGATEAPALPFRLAGVIQQANNIFLPMMFLTLVMTSEDSKKKYCFVFAVAAFAIYGIAAGFITSSRVPVATVWISLLLIWIIQQRLSVKRIIGLAVTLPLVLGYSMLLSILRTVRSAAPNISEPSAPSATIDSLGEGGVAGIVLKVVDVVFRFGGADGYLNVISSNISRSPAESLLIILGIHENSTLYFNRNILGYAADHVGTAFSPSVMGYFYIAWPNILVASALLIFFLSFWHYLYVVLRSRFLTIGPAVLAVLLVALAFYTSEGTLESLPQRLGIIAVSAMLIEVAVRLLARTNPIAAQ